MFTYKWTLNLIKIVDRSDKLLKEAKHMILLWSQIIVRYAYYAPIFYHASSRFVR